jgi:vancomycin resistance protein VanW
VRRRISELHPALYDARVAELRLQRRLGDWWRRTRFASTVSRQRLPIELVHHRSVLRRRLRGVDPRLQETKIINLRLAAKAIDGLVIRPGEVFSFWQRIGPPTAKRGFAEGLILRHGEVQSGIGGGLCQLSNLLYWMALHTSLHVVEQHHHSFDAFPDDRRVLPFGSGASVFHNYGDVRIANPTDNAFQVHVWVTERHLRGSIRSERELPIAYHVEERNHRFRRAADGRVFRDNELWRRLVDRRTGETVGQELITRNHALVKYPVPESLIGTVQEAGAAC